MTRDLQTELEAIYEQVMWLARQPLISAGNARAWYTHVMAEKVKRKIRHFTGKVSQAAVSQEGTRDLRLEHYKRIQTVLTGLVERHRKLKRLRPQEFVNAVLECEQVHIVTSKENHAAMLANGDYRKAGIALISWRSVPPGRQRELWRKVLRGKVANAESYAPKQA